MRGHEIIIDARKKGLKPAMVQIVDFECKYLTDGDVYVFEDKDLTALDFRFVYGLTVGIAGECDKRARQLLEICKFNDADYVVMVTTRRGAMNRVENGLLEVWSKKDAMA